MMSNPGCLLGRVWNPAVSGPSVVTIREGRVIDITSPEAPLVRDICAMDEPAAYVSAAKGEDLGALADIMEDVDRLSADYSGEAASS